MPIGLWLLFSLSFVLEVAAAIAIVRGRHYRRFPLVLIETTFGAIVIVLGVAVITNAGYSSRAYALLYYTDDILLHGLIVVLILSLIADAARVSGSGMGRVMLLAGAVVVFGFGSLGYYYEPGTLRWMTPLSRNLSFCEEILNFILWAALIRNRTRDTLLLAVSVGIGLQVTGEVIGNTLLLYAPSSLAWLPKLLVVGSEMLCLVIWFYAFWRTAAAPAQQHVSNSHATG